VSEARGAPEKASDGRSAPARDRASEARARRGRRIDPAEVPALVEQFRAGRRRALSRLLTQVENGTEAGREALRALYGASGRAHVVGVTGPPGAGKSTLVNRLIGVWRARGRTVAVVAVDPSSSLTGGATLGDRVRMMETYADEGVFIRSMATRGQLGGLAWATPQAVRVLDGAGFDVVIVETVGVGQSEVEVAGLADVTVVLLAPGMGDGVQAAKAGILEVGDVFVVNKADRDGADATVRDIRHAISLGFAADARTPGEPARWRPPVLTTVATTGKGIDDLLDALDKHERWATASGALRERRLRRAEREIEEIAITALRERMVDLGHRRRLGELAAEVVDAKLDPYRAADELLVRL
jgi:LAO/AO transport system kinase